MFLIDDLKNQQTFTFTEKRIAGYILEHLSAIPRLSINELAEQAFASRSAVIRLCQKLGLSGYKEFKAAIVEIIPSYSRSLDTINPNFPFDIQDSSEQIAQKMGELMSVSIQQAVSQINGKVIDETVEMLLQAERIFLFARGDSQLTARSFQNKLMKINLFPILAEEYGDEEWTAANLTAKDCALFLSYGGNNSKHSNILTHFSKNAIPSILMTGNKNSPLLDLTSIRIVIPQVEYDFAKIATFASQTAFDYLLNTIFSVLYMKHYRSNIEKLQTVQHLYQTGLFSD
ncbi:MurR/RpiR family transcriptional regulator [Enterococcus sp. LJL128]|uniref:MurR/RpiR family transcriptional regulator n=1 Tax=Enterococcus sp. LJL51 TaxID=3416656 RepID=UPI003CF06432